MSEHATFAGGCFWGIEHVFNKEFAKYDIKTKVGYTGGNTESPDYKLVCTGTTNHAEALDIAYDPAKISYETLLEFFYRVHDPTLLNAQGRNTGTQYRSAIFYHSSEQKETAEKVTQKIQEERYKDKKIVTEIIPAVQFFDAEEYHQLYIEKNPEGYVCHYPRW
ncbi:hypothetical protein BDA99DRAFT_547015 [Phascolomyces articulosus]|uniref:peptide-methionine (S)-S-oxide reductase n=1 Tax=Phascolomyces articulosus TaxID=60185 RepID=A0AAD5K9R2_9FUNG|nr:hypothetical protein BDA99DRAFT_547015 [Phascolomyces articulosus]